MQPGIFDRRNNLKEVCVIKYEPALRSYLGGFHNNLPGPDAHGARRGFYFCLSPSADVIIR